MKARQTFVASILTLKCVTLSLAWVWSPWALTRPRRKNSWNSLHLDATRERTFSAWNTSDGESWLPSMGHMGQAIKSLDTLIPEDEEEPWKRALHHTHAILDLYNDTGRGLSEDLLMTTLENVVQLSIRHPHEVTEEILENVESLVWRLREVGLVPSIQVLDSLWRIQLYHRQNRSEKASKQVGRQVNLLTHWREWSKITTQGGDGKFLEPPPEAYLLDILQYAIVEQVSMSFSLWDLYQSVSGDPVHPCGRSVYSYVLQLLAQSPPDWNVRQRRVCNDMISQSRQKCIDPYWPTANEIQQSLQAAARVGRAQDAAWLLRTLDASPDVSTQTLQDCRTLFVQALLFSDDPGSLLYMEELLSSDKWENPTTQQWKYLLMKYTQSRREGCGSRAANMINNIQRKYEQEGRGWNPDFEWVCCVVQAYLNEPQRTLRHVVQATNFVKKAFINWDMVVSIEKPVRLFDTLLAAFDEYARTDPEAVAAADDLFRFYLVQHRDGRILHEEPDQYHLGHILRYYNRQYKKQMVQKSATKSLEYFRLFRTLARRKVIPSPPDLFNVRQLLGTLARSTEPGMGTVANETLAEALTLESPMHPYALGHMYWCVIKCYCNEGQVHKALEVLQQWEQAYSTKPSSVRLTGAPYQTLIHTLVGERLAPEKKVDLALGILDRLDQQLETGNGYIVLRSKLYKEALQCCQSDALRRREVHHFFARQNFTTPVETLN